MSTEPLRAPEKAGGSFWIRLAQTPIFLAPSGAYFKTLCENYRIAPTRRDRELYAAWREKQNAPPREPLFVTKEELLAEQPAGDGGTSLEELESLAFCRKICNGLLEEDVCLFHCSALMFQGGAFLFTAPSGVGKSTHTMLWRELFGSAVSMINDDKPLLRLGKGEEPLAFGSPWGGKEQIQRNISAPVKGIAVLYRAQENRIRRLSAKEAYPFLLAQTYQKRKDPGAMAQTLELVSRLAETPTYALGCTPQPEAAKLAACVMAGARVKNEKHISGGKLS